MRKHVIALIAGAILIPPLVNASEIAIKEVVPDSRNVTFQTEIAKIETEMLKPALVTKRRILDLKGYPCFTTVMPVGKNGECGYQSMDYGSFERDILADVHRFNPTQDNPMVWVEVGAGFGAFPLRVFEYVSNPKQAQFIVNDVDSNNLKNLLTLVLQSKNKPQNQELYSSFKVIPGDCLTLYTMSQFKQHVPLGADFISELNLFNYLSPYKIVLSMALASENLKVGGKYYILHDLPKTRDIDPYVEEKLLKNLSKRLLESFPQMFKQIHDSVMNDEKARDAVISKAYNTIESYMQKNKFEFPGFFSANLLKDICYIPYDQFQPDPQFIEEVAQIVGLQLEKKTPLCRKGYYKEQITVEDADLQNANSIGYSFVKEKSDTNFREMPAFQNMIIKAEWANIQRQNLEFKRIPTYPFIEVVQPKK